MQRNHAHAWAEIDLRALKINLGLLWHGRPQRSVIGVVKADAYGHGAVEAARALLSEGVEALAVATIPEAAALKAAGIDCPVLLLGAFSKSECAEIVELGLTASISSMEFARALNAAAAARKRRVAAHVKVDTGMGRLGVPLSCVVPALQEMSMMPNVALEGIYTHFACADEEDKTHTMQQIARFNRVVSTLAAQGITFKYHHAASSAACLEIPEAHFDTLRPGLSLYGLHPAPECGKAVKLRPVMEFCARVVQFERRPAGTTIGYNRTHKLARDAVVAVVSAGYADGYDRRFSGRAVVTINGKQCPVLGRISMDLTSVDATGAPNLALDDRAVLFSADPAAANSVEKLAQLIDTIPYTLTCGVSKRVERVYRNSE